MLHSYLASFIFGGETVTMLSESRTQAQTECAMHKKDIVRLREIDK